MPELSTSAITERLTAAMEKDTAALLTVAAEIAKASGRPGDAIADWLLTDVQRNYQKILNLVQAGHR